MNIEEVMLEAVLNAIYLHHKNKSEVDDVDVDCTCDIADDMGCSSW